MGWIKKKLVELCLFIDTIIYNFTSFSYRVFSLVCGISLFDEDGNSIIATITNRIYVILGVVMLFVLAYEILKNIANPDGISSSDDTSVKGIAKNAIIALAILAFSPVIFKYMSVFQNNIIKQNVIGNIILGSTTETEDDYIDSAGLRIAISVFSTFYHPAQDDMTSCKDMISDYDDDKPLDPDDFEGDRAQLCAEYINAANRAEQNVSFKYFSEDEELNSKVYDYTMDYSPVLSAIAGAIACYMFLSYAIDAGKRVAKLAFYEIIAPIPIICKIFKPSVFNKWLKDITKTYVELFTRLAIVFFAVYLISIIPELNVFQRGDHTGGVIVVAFANCIIILGLLAFAKEAPKLLEDLLEIKIGELKIKKKVEPLSKPIGALGGMAMGAIGGAARRAELQEGKGRKIAAGFSGALGGAIGGARRGWNGNYENGLGQGIRNAHQANMEAGSRRDIIRGKGAEAHNGKASPFNFITGSVRSGWDSVKDEYGNLKQNITGNGLTANEAAKKSMASLKAQNDATMSVLPNNSDAQKYDEAKKKIIEDMLKGNLSNKQLKTRLENAGFTREDLTSAGYDSSKGIENQMEAIKKLYDSKIIDIRSEGMNSEDIEKFVQQDLENLNQTFAKISSTLSESERTAIADQITNMKNAGAGDFKSYIEQKTKLSKTIDKQSNSISRNMKVGNDSK